MFKNKNRYVIATPSALTRRLRKKKRVGLLTVVFLGGAVLFVSNQWQPQDAELRTVRTQATSDSAQNAAQAASKENGLVSRLFQNKPAVPEKPAGPIVDKTFLRDALSSHVAIGEFPSQLGYNGQPLYINYTIDQSLQDWAEARLKTYNPDYGVFVALEPDTGEILALATSRRDEQQSADLALRGTYPAASTFKLITAAATLEEGIATPETIFAFNGKSTSLYKKQVYTVKENKWTRKMSFKTAFAKSVNPIFGRLGAKQLGPKTLVDYAERFGFNAQFVSDFEFDNGSIEIDPEDDWQAAESAAGYTRRNTLSPIHGAVIAAAVANGGKLISPSIVKSVTNAQNEVLYNSDKPVSITAISEQSARSLQKLMHATITEGTGRKSFRSFTKSKFPDVNTGGKSGHLRGFVPKGSYDWFIGYGERDSRKIAYAMLSINKEKWYVKSSKFAREALEFYFKQQPTKMATRTKPGKPAETS